MADATDADATDATDPADATIARLLDFADSGNYDRDDVVRFVDFEERILCQDFRAATRANGRVWRDIFHSRLAVARCEVSVARFVDALFRVVAEVPGAFAPWDAYKNDTFYKETRARLVSACCQPEASAYHEVARKMWHLALPDHVTQRKICLRHLHVLRHFQSLLDDPEAIFFQHETLEELVSNPPAQFVESLRSRNVHLDDLAHCLPGFVSPNVAPVSTRTFQLAADAFLGATSRRSTSPWSNPSRRSSSSATSPPRPSTASSSTTTSPTRPSSPASPTATRSGRSTSR